MNTSAVQNETPQAPAAPAAPATPPKQAAPAVPPVTTPEGAQPSAPATPPAAAPGAQPAPQRQDPLAGSNWPPSAKDRVRDLSRKNREHEGTIASQRAYIKQLEEQQGKLVLPKREDYADDASFSQAMLTYHSEQTGINVEKRRVEGEVKKTEEATAQITQEAMAAKVEAARARFQDWDQVVRTSPLQFSQHLQYAIYQASNGPEIAYILAKAPQELARLNSLSWNEALQEFSGLEHRFTATHTPAAPPVPPVPPTPPIAPVGGGTLPSNSRQKEWEAQRNASKGPF